MTGGPAVAGEHPWLLVDDFTTSRRILTQCIALADDVHPSSKAHVDVSIAADRVFLALNNARYSHTSETSGVQGSSPGAILEALGHEVVELLTMAWAITPTHVLKNLLDDAVDQYTETLLGMADIATTEIGGYLESIDALMSANPQGHDIETLKKSKSALMQLNAELHRDQIKSTSPRWTIPGDRMDARQLSQDIQEYYDAHHISTEDESQRLAIAKSLETAVRGNAEWSDANIQLYGSSLSTMGTRGCDMDLCLSSKPPTSDLFVSRNVAIAKARQAHELALQKLSNRTNGLDMLTRVKKQMARVKKEKTRLVKLDKTPPESEKPSEKIDRVRAIASTLYFVNALTQFVHTLKGLKHTPALLMPQELADQIAHTKQELKTLKANTTKRVKMLDQLKGVLQREGCKVKKVISKARVPIIKFLHVDSNLECDLCMENTLAAKNTGLLRAYGWFDPRVSPLVLAVKKWAKSRGVNDASQNTLSSYSYAILVIHFMQTLGILPNLQDPALLEQLKVPHETLNGYDVTFCADVAACRKIVQLNEMAELGVGDLLVLFFDYFAAFPWLSRVVSIRGTDQAKRDRWKGAAKTWRLSIEDPFETTRDLGIVLTATGQEKVLKEFARAKQVLAETGCFAKLVAAAEMTAKPGGGAAANDKPPMEENSEDDDSDDADSATSPVKETTDEQDGVGAHDESGEGLSTLAAPSKTTKPRNKKNAAVESTAPSPNSKHATGECDVTSAHNAANKADTPRSAQPTRKKHEKTENADKKPAPPAAGTAAQNATLPPEHEVEPVGLVPNVQVHSHQNSKHREPINRQKRTPIGAEGDALPAAHSTATSLPLPAPVHGSAPLHGSAWCQPLQHGSAAPSSQFPSRNRKSHVYRAKGTSKATESS